MFFAKKNKNKPPVFYTKNGDTDDRYAYLNESDVKKLAKNPLISLGCHSYNLHSLSTRRGMGKIYGESEEEYKELIYNDIENMEGGISLLCDNDNNNNINPNNNIDHPVNQ